MENLNELIEINLNLLYKADKNEMFFHEFIDVEGNQLNSLFRGEQFATELQTIDLIRIHQELCTITQFGIKIVKNGGWLKYLTELEGTKSTKQEQKLIKEKLEFNLVKSNLEANKLNKKAAKRNKKNEKNNRITTFINIGIGIINLGILIWQIIKTK